MDSSGDDDDDDDDDDGYRLCDTGHCCSEQIQEAPIRTEYHGEDSS